MLGSSRPARLGCRPRPTAVSERHSRTHSRDPIEGREGDRNKQVKASVINCSFLSKTKRSEWAVCPSQLQGEMAELPCVPHSASLSGDVL